MENSKWRKWAKAVAYVDLVLLSINLIAVFILVFLSVGMTAAGDAALHDPELMKKMNESGVSQDEVSSMLSAATWMLWTFTAFLALITGVQMWATIKLLNSAEIGVELNEAVGKARTWRNVTIVFLVIGILDCFVLSFWIGLFTILWRAGFLFIVCKFIQELEYAITSQSGGGNYPVSVIVNKQ